MLSFPGTEEIVQASVIKKLLTIQEMAADPDFLRGVLGLYLEHTPPLVDQLAAAIDQRKRSEILRLAHRIKGSSASVGAERLAALCACLESSGIDLAPDQETTDAVQMLRQIFEQTRIELGALL